MINTLSLKKCLLLILLIVTSFELQAQKIYYDVFGNLQYESTDKRYTASLKKNVFDDLIFTDKKNNEVTFKKKYLGLYHKDLSRDKTASMYFFQDLIDRYASASGYKATFEIDIFNKTIISDNLGEKVELGTDIFDNLKYESRDRGYTASLEKDIFDNLVFTDNRDNKLTFEKEYLNRYHKTLLKDKTATEYFFLDLTDKYISDTGYKATYEIDILGNVVITDNRGHKTEIGKDFSGNPVYLKKKGNINSDIRRDASGNLVYTSGKEQAFLKKDYLNQWSYSDSKGTTVSFSDKAWDKLMHRYKTEEDVCFYLIYKFLH